MVKLILVATPTPGFGELIQQTLEETARYQVILVNDGAEAIERAQAHHFSLCIVDSEVSDIPLPKLVEILVKLIPDLRVIAIPPDNDPSDALLVGVSVQDTLTKPFYLPDLIMTVDLALSSASKSSVHPPKAEVNPASRVIRNGETPAWLQDVTRAAQYLTSLSLESSALAALIVREGQLWAYAGQLSNDAAQELAGNVVGYLNSDQDYSKKSDLARFTTLKATGSEYMLYATSLGREMVLALAFDTETPFSKIRTQAGQLARALASLPPPAITEEEHASLGAMENSEASLPRITEVEELEEDWEDIPLPAVKPLLEDVPPPRPNDPLPIQETPADQVERKPASPKSPPVSSPIIPLGREVSGKPYRVASNGPGLLPISIRSDVNRVSDGDPLAETRPHVFSRSKDAGNMNLRPISPAMCNLNYACVLIPRMPKHRLIGDLVDALADWIPQICLAFGWRLAGLSVNPTHIECVIALSPSTSPSYLMRILRQQTSQRILSGFPVLASENPSGDFWAPGYLIMSSSQPPPMNIVQDFIQQIRQQQGAYKPDPQSWK